MKTYKLIGTKEGESKEDAIIRCANNLVKAVLAGGYSIHATDGLSWVDISFYSHAPGEITVSNCLANWGIKGYTPLKVPFALPEEDLIQED